MNKKFEQRKRKIKEIKKISNKKLEKNYGLNSEQMNIIQNDSAFNGSHAHFNEVFAQVQEKMGAEVRWIGFSRDSISSVYISKSVKV